MPCHEAGGCDAPVSRMKALREVPFNYNVCSAVALDSSTCGRGQRRRGGARNGRSPGHAAVPAARHSTTQRTNVRRVHHNPNQTSVHRYAHFATTRNNQSSTVTYLTNHKNYFCESGNVPPFYRWNVSDDQHWSCRNVVSAGLREMEGHRTCHDPGPAHRRAADV